MVRQLTLFAGLTLSWFNQFSRRENLGKAAHLLRGWDSRYRTIYVAFRVLIPRIAIGSLGRYRA